MKIMLLKEEKFFYHCLTFVYKASSFSSPVLIRTTVLMKTQIFSVSYFSSIRNLRYSINYLISIIIPPQPLFLSLEENLRHILSLYTTRYVLFVYKTFTSVMVRPVTPTSDKASDFIKLIRFDYCCN